jgi:branched-chain amino acid transport system ATP-binding protein
MMEVEHLSVAYGKRPVVHDVSFQVNDCELALLVGGNGSGKSTILKAIFGLIQASMDSATRIEFNGKSILGYPSSELLEAGLMYVPQRDFCFETLTVLENLEISGLSLNSSQLFRERLGSVLQTFPLIAPNLRRTPLSMSAGERQMLALGMALLHRPKMIMLDEPFAGLSQSNVELLRTIIQQLNRSDRITFLMVEHRLSMLAGWRCHALVLKMGSICADRTDCDDPAEQLARFMF